MALTIAGIGSSAGGLEACTRLIGILPTDLAYILVQHLDPHHESMMADLLAGHTRMTVLEASDGLRVEQGHLYVIPPGTYLALAEGVLRLSAPLARHGARLPFDFLLNSLAEQCGTRAIGIVLSGTGSDGSLGIAAIRKAGGLVIAQDPEEAKFGGMPQSAIATGVVDHVLALADMPAALAAHGAGLDAAGPQTDAPGGVADTDAFAAIITLLRSRTAHDFALYKRGTLLRRTERRMGLMSLAPADLERYLEVLRGNQAELDLLAKDLLINVTSFFRDQNVFDMLSEKIVPDLVSGKAEDQALRIWVPGCSTGEETYSLAMLFREQIAAAKRTIKLQIFASDVDTEAIAHAREGLYPTSIEASVSPERLDRFFTRENQGYRITPEVRSTVIFTVQDVLTDPPFSRLDLVSCRNLLIYLQPEAQTKAISLFNFALREGGILLLGSSETIGDHSDRFAVISKSERLFRRLGRTRTGELAFALGTMDNLRPMSREVKQPSPDRQTALAGLCRQMVLDACAPASVLITSTNEALYFLGPTDRYFQVAAGFPMSDILAMAREDVRGALRSALLQTTQATTVRIHEGDRISHDGKSLPFSIRVQPVVFEGEQLRLISFLETSSQASRPAEEGRASPESGTDALKVKELQRELNAAHIDLEAALRNLEISAEEQKAVSEEARSVNEEYQSTNEELLTSKEELQSLNEELTALNSQLQETLERQRTTFNDLQNILYSTNVATLFLDPNLNIRFFTPATKLLFNVIPGDVGRPLADLTSLSADAALPTDVREVLRTLLLIEREVETRQGLWFLRRILPYRTRDETVEGVVITFTDVSDRKQAARTLEVAKQQADLANTAKSRFLAAASHDLRQPLQTLSLLEGLLAKTVEGEKAKRLVARFEQTLGSMSGILNTLLDINQIEAGNVRAERIDFRIGDLLDRMRDEFTYHAQTKRLSLRVVSCNLVMHSDPRLLEQMIRNLLSNALKFTKKGKVLLGVRRRKGIASIEIWDTGIGIPEAELQSIFDEYHQLENPARVRNLGLGLGLSIFQRLGNLLGHRVRVRSHLGKGSSFAIELVMAPEPAAIPPVSSAPSTHVLPPDKPDHTRTVLVVEDDSEVRELLELLIADEGHNVLSAADGVIALDLLAQGKARPDIILADFNLPNGMTGLELAKRIRDRFNRKLPVIILTGDISSETFRQIAAQECIQINKPVKLRDLTQVMNRLLALPIAGAPRLLPHVADQPGVAGLPLVIVVDDDAGIRETMRDVFEDDGRRVEAYPSSESFLAAYHPGQNACLLIDAYLPGMSGLELLQHLHGAGELPPAIMITGNSDVAMTVQAMKAGAIDFIEKPIGRTELLAVVHQAFAQSHDVNMAVARRADAARHVASLTPRQRQIMALVLAGHPSKNIAADLGISQRTVENHRAAIMERMGAKSLPALARQALAAGD